MIRTASNTCLLLVLATAVSGQRPAPSPTAFAALDVFELEWAADPRIAPAGDRIAYVRSGMDVMKDRARSELWLVSAGGGEHRALVTAGNPRGPRWSPDGKRLLYSATIDKKSQLLILDLESGRSHQVTRVQRSPGSARWSPDGRRIAFTMAVPQKKKRFISMPERPDGAEWAEAPRIIERAYWRRDGGGYVKDQVTQLFVVTAEGGTPRQLTRGAFSVRGAPSWTPDGAGLVISSNRRQDWEYASNDTELYRVDASTGELKQLTDRRGPDNGPQVSPDGRLVAWTGYDEKMLSHQGSRLWVMPLAGGEPRCSSKELDRGIGRFQWVPRQGGGLCIQYADKGVVTVALLDMDGKLTPVVTGLGGTSLGRPYTSGSFTATTVSAKDGGPELRIAYTVGSPERPADVGFARPGNRRPRVLTRLNEDLLGNRRTGKVQELWCKSSHDQRDIQGWVLTPPDFDPGRKYPMILEIHGGPHAAYGPTWSTECQLYAARGYVVLYTNPRGSTSYGQDFANLIHHAYPGHDYDDLMSAVDAIIAKGFVDAGRLYVTGGSGGGVLTSWIVGKTHRFRAAVVAKPVINWYSFALTSDGYLGFARRWFPGPPWEHLEHYMKRSPISLVGNVQTPTMLLTGDADTRTPMSESEQYYQALKMRRIPSMLVRIPGASHGIASRPSRLIAKTSCILAWFARYGGPGPDR